MRYSIMSESENKEKKFVSAVLYLHNDGRYIGEFIKKLHDFMSSTFENSEIICVDDLSGDDTCDALKAAVPSGSNVTVTLIRLSCFHGLEAAMDAGTDLAIGDYVFEFDDIRYGADPDTIRKVYDTCLGGCDIVSAAPKGAGSFGARLFYRLFNRFSNSRYNMVTESFRIISRRAVNRIKGSSNSVAYRKARYAESGLKTDTVTYECRRSGGGRDSAEKRYRMDLGIEVLLLFTDVGYKVSLWLSVFFLLLTLFGGVYSIIAYIISDTADGWPSTILFMSVVFFGVFIILTIIVKYLQILVNLSIRRKHYSFESVEKLR
uniref:Glycosyl transferase family 2 n=1 Tax=uncultured bacterium Contig783 TaxID=1393612 RepID=W0FPF7_9BACT|nr:glycosyl transferase family 2 [uncultured bacterium Contig783]